jgi:DNA-binding LacI/PurR family transcriptional regulator
MPATIRDVAKRANVGIATVSRVLNNSTSVSKETRKKVLKAIKELDYTPNPIARRLSLGRTLTIGVVLPFLTLPSYVERLRGIQNALAETEYDLVLYTAGTPDQKGAYFSRLASKSQVDGLLVISLSPTDKQANRFVEADLPVVLIDARHPKLCSIFVDDIAGGYLATKHLIELGHTKIAYLSDYIDTPFHFIAFRNRYTGYLQALEEAGIPFRPDYHQQGEIGGQEAPQNAKVLLELPNPPSAIFAASDTYAIGVLNAAQQLGIKVPDELSVIGFDGIRDAQYLNLTTIKQPLFDSGVKGVNLLLSLLESRLETQRDIKLPINFIRGRTTTSFSGSALN